MQMVRTLRAIFIVLVSCISIALVSLYVYTHRPIDHIPSDSGRADSITFFALGDQGTGGLKQWMVARAMEKQAEHQRRLDFVALMGDNFYSSDGLTLDSPEWMSSFEHVYAGTYLNATPFYAVLGNHDYGVSDSAEDKEHNSQEMHFRAKQNTQVQLDYSRKHMGSNRWRMPGHYYSADFGDVHGRVLLRIVFIDTNLPHEDLLTEADFIRQQFTSASSNPIWRIVVGHHPIRTYGKHFGETKRIEETILPALKEAHVDLYLSGHDHNQQVIARNGEPVYVVSGGGGKSTYALTKESPDLRFAKSVFGFAGVTVDGESLNFSIYDAEGTAISSYEIAQSCRQCFFNGAY